MIIEVQHLPRPTPTNDYENSVFENIEKYGWHCTSVGGGDGSPCFTYSVGLFDSFGHPELLVIGLSAELSHSMISAVARAAENKPPIELDKPCDNLLGDASCVFVTVPHDQYADWVISARWYYQGDDFPLYQIVWPAVGGPFPWEPTADEKLKSSQPVLGNPAEVT